MGRGSGSGADRVVVGRSGRGGRGRRGSRIVGCCMWGGDRRRRRWQFGTLAALSCGRMAVPAALLAMPHACRGAVTATAGVVLHGSRILL
eukprot:6541235-Prymnesium_polylepis.1